MSIPTVGGEGYNLNDAAADTTAQAQLQAQHQQVFHKQPGPVGLDPQQVQLNLASASEHSQIAAIPSDPHSPEELTKVEKRGRK